MRKTKNELRRLQVAGFYLDADLGDPVRVLDDVEKAKAKDRGISATTDSRFQLLEMHVDLDLPGYEDKDDEGNFTGIALPYVVTIEKGSMEVLSIRRNWRPEDEKKAKRQHFVHYGYVPGFGFYCFGLIHLVGAFAKSGTSLIRQLVDAGTLSNLPGGFKTRGLRIKGDDTPISPGEFRDVDVPSGAIRDNLMPLPYKEPSQVLYSLFNTIVEEGRRFASSADMQISDMSAQAPVGTTLAILERTLKVMSAVQARIHYSMKQELKLLKEIIRDYTDPDYTYEPEDGDRSCKKSDYDHVDVIPVSDPNAATMAQKIVQYQAVLQLAQQAPQIYNMPVLHRQMLDVLGIRNAQKLIPMVDDMKPKDPIAENMDILTMKPVKAFIYQDQEAHIATHQAFMQDPQVAAMLGQNPQAQAMMAALQAHISEHFAFKYRQQIEQQLGAPLPYFKDDDDESIAEDVEVQISRAVAQAAKQLTMQNMAQAQQQQAQQQAEDPIIQMQQQELALKGEEQKPKAAKDATDAQLRQMEISDHKEIELHRIELEARKFGANMAKDKAKDAFNTQKLGIDTDIAGHKMGIDAAKSNKQQDIQKGQIAAQLIAAKMNVDANEKARESNTEKKGKDKK
jgi:hypothetical protein